MLAVAAERVGREPLAATLAAELSLEVVSIETPPDPIAALLVVTPERLEVRQLGPDAPGPVYADFVGGKTGYRRQGEGKSQPLARAVGLRKRPHTTVLDATAGLGQDGFVLASLGAEVVLVERSPVVAALLADGVARALRHPDTHDAASRLCLYRTDATDLLRTLAPDDYPDVVYLDPMYPHSGKSALKGKAMRLFRTLVGDDPDAAELLRAALAVARDRVVVKRPKTAPVLGERGEREPSTAIVGKTTRYDLYITSALPR